ncbi:hypothetical protein BLNAU_7226 [Blattamonas nauphoetae]|uniref:Uncharacterized protein n=1 Tax=Blattamonas nauphoetae TaxID=2049346 RepID=A0ABQ9Y215_9EUKA|nr:hypothetical protein BLNAU_7226 [Blattamonas nauphoetae]
MERKENNRNSRTHRKQIEGGCGMMGMWGAFQFGEINEKCFRDGPKVGMGKIIWSQCIVEGRKELFGERTVDDVTVKDSRVENDEPKRSNHFWTIRRDPRSCSSAPAIKIFPKSEESPQKALWSHSRDDFDVARIIRFADWVTSGPSFIHFFSKELTKRRGLQEYSQPSTIERLLENAIAIGDARTYSNVGR